MAGLLGLGLGRLARADEAVRVVAIGPELELELEDRRRVVLEGILMPPVRYPELARRWLKRHVVGRAIELTAAHGDRHGRLLAQPIPVGQPILVAQPTLAGASLQQALLSQGLAWCLPAGLQGPIAAGLLAAEAVAREAGRGIWADPALGDQDAAALEAGRLRFAVVKGRALAVARQRTFVYVNFGEDRRRDFTVRIETAELRRFRRAGVDPLVLPGSTVRVRGWLFRLGGPMIEVTEPTQIEVVRCEVKRCAEG